MLVGDVREDKYDLSALNVLKCKTSFKEVVGGDDFYIYQIFYDNNTDVFYFTFLSMLILRSSRNCMIRPYTISSSIILAPMVDRFQNATAKEKVG